LTDRDSVRTLTDGYVEGLLAFRPTSATLLGDHRYDGDLGDPTADAVNDFLRFLRTLHDELEHVSGDALDPEDDVDRRLLVSALRTDMLDLQEIRTWEHHPHSFLDPPLEGCFALLVADWLPAAERVESLVARLEKVPSFVAAGRRTVLAAPEIHVESALLAARTGMEFFRTTVVDWVEGNDPDHVDVVRAVVGPAADAYEETIDWLEDMPRLGDFAVGEELFAARLREAHLVELPPAAVAERGESLVRATLDELDEVASARDPSRSWREQIEELKDDHPSAEELLGRYEDVMRWTREVVTDGRLAPLPPGDPPLLVEPTPRPWRHTIPYAAYVQPPPLSSGAVGRFWVTPPDDGMGTDELEDALRGHGTASIVLTAVHEGYPGHHLQLCWANAHPTRLRRIADAPMFVEGWGLYCEELFHEHGLYDDGTRLWQLKDQLWRALRVVLDVNLHCGDETVAGAVRALVDVADLEEANARAEVRRYTETPTYPLSYALGKEGIVALRDRVRTALGPRFDENAFHERLLRNGTLPISLAEKALLDDMAARP
jgi:uncharacterized protein (DUF885 family)